MSKITLNKVSRVKYKASVKASPEEHEKAEGNALQKVGAKAKISGFRQGKVPEHIIKTKYADEIADKTFQSLLEMAADQIITENKTSLYKINSIENVKPDKAGYSFDLTYETLPHVELGKMKNYTLKEDTPVISKSDLEKELAEVQKMYAETEIRKPEETAQNGDLITLDVERWSDGAPVGQPEHGVQIILGENRFSKKLEEEMIKKPAKVDEEFRETVETEVPGEDGKSQKKNIDVIAKIKSIYAVKLPELTPEIIKKYDSSCENIDQLKKQLEKTMSQRFARKNMAMEINRVMEEILKEADVEFPENYLAEKFHKYLNDNQKYFEKVPEDKLSEIESMFNDETRKRLVNDHIMALATEKVENYKDEFSAYLAETFDAKTAEMGRQLYESIVEKNVKDSYSGQILDNFLKYFHYHLLENYFRSQGLVKKNKKVPYDKFMSES